MSRYYIGSLFGLVVKFSPLVFYLFGPSDSVYRTSSTFWTIVSFSVRFLDLCWNTGSFDRQTGTNLPFKYWISLVFRWLLWNKCCYNSKRYDCVPVGRESKCIDGIIVVKGVKMLAIIQVPEHGLGVLSAGCAQGTVGWHSHSVQVSVVANVVGLELAVS